MAIHLCSMFESNTKKTGLKVTGEVDEASGGASVVAAVPQDMNDRTFSTIEKLLAMRGSGGATNGVAVVRQVKRSSVRASAECSQ